MFAAAALIVGTSLNVIHTGGRARRKSDVGITATPANAIKDLVKNTDARHFLEYDLKILPIASRLGCTEARPQ